MSKNAMSFYLRQLIVDSGASVGSWLSLSSHAGCYMEVETSFRLCLPHRIISRGPLVAEATLGSTLHSPCPSLVLTSLLFLLPEAFSHCESSSLSAWSFPFRGLSSIGCVGFLTVLTFKPVVPLHYYSQSLFASQHGW